MKKVRRIFLAGLMAIVPIAVTLYVLYWIGSAAEGIFGPLLSRALPERYYKPGMGLVVGVVVIFAVGVLVHFWFVRRLMRYGGHLLSRIPLVKTLYGSVRDLMGYFSSSDDKDVNQVAMLTLGDGPARVIGVVTRTHFDDLPSGMGGEGDVAVFVPMSYQMGGFTLIVPRSKVQPIDLTFEEAMRLSLTACMSTRKELPEGAEDEI